MTATTCRPEGAFAVRRLRLTDFRNYRRAALDPVTETTDGTPPIVLIGPNGAGKTNLLEAVSYLAPGRGLRAARLTDVARIDGDGGWAVAATVVQHGRETALGTGIRSGKADMDGEDPSRQRREVRIDGQTMGGPGQLGAAMAALWLTPQMDRLFLEGPAGRRRFLDRMALALHPGHGSAVNAYERAMRERNRLLADHGRGADTAWLSALERRMAEHGVAIAAARVDTAGVLDRFMATAGWQAFPAARVAPSGVIEGWLSAMPALEAEEHFTGRLAAARGRDRDLGRAGLGPHRSDFEVWHLEKEMPARLCSTGEQKALLIGLVLANARLRLEQHGTAPILLLDEVAAHLDADRRAALFGEIAGLGSQVWLTGTEPGLFSGLADRAQFYTVAAGSITASARGRATE